MTIEPTPAAPPPAPIDPMRAIAETKSYTGQAAMAAFLTITPLFFIGFYLAWNWRKEARRYQAIAGHEIPGQGCLGFVFWFNVLGSLAWLALFGLFGLGMLASLAG